MERSVVLPFSSDAFSSAEHQSWICGFLSCAVLKANLNLLNRGIRRESEARHVSDRLEIFLISFDLKMAYTFSSFKCFSLSQNCPWMNAGQLKI